MHTLRLRINDHVYDKLIWLLGKFNKDEVEVIDEGNEFIESQKLLSSELNDVKIRKSSSLTLNEVADRLDNIINKRRNKHR
jgi:hypothetical protein